MNNFQNSESCYNDEKCEVTEPKECLQFTSCQKRILIGDFDDKAKNLNYGLQ